MNAEGELHSKIDQIWNAFWACGIANPIMRAGGGAHA
ncbi:hypothetical protein NB311A_16192 [Nitrobacter sp. Nb-311A]|nr:hypothetical protein NB311A_16192 [Nitrobacter sp. Nb-311A]